MINKNMPAETTTSIDALQKRIDDLENSGRGYYLKGEKGKRDDQFWSLKTQLARLILKGEGKGTEDKQEATSKGKASGEVAITAAVKIDASNGDQTGKFRRLMKERYDLSVSAFAKGEGGRTTVKITGQLSKIRLWAIKHYGSAEKAEAAHSNLKKQS